MVTAVKRDLVFDQWPEPVLDKILEKFGDLVGAWPSPSHFMQVTHYQPLLFQGMFQFLFRDAATRASLHGDEEVNRSRGKGDLYKGYGAIAKPMQFVPRLEVIHDTICGAFANLENHFNELGP